ncbi:MAG: glycoside hydrolase family 140 protein, partial [Oscillospiraceae bacterium]|nr:glycoside hydrolase family 140 protein [Oscillospiraceae bacterium]
SLYTEAYTRRLARYWVARYAAYPVLWTTAQEADDDFYYKEQQPYYDAARNPWKIVAEAVGEYDPYRHPLTAHQENSGHTQAGNSEFGKLPAHSWFAAQWSPPLNSAQDFAVPKDYWNNGGGKPAVNYEGRYENLWTKNFGARAQGWLSFLNGMYGYGYGAIDIWLYQSAYDIDTTSSDGIDTITPADKAVPWTQSLYFETAGQLGHMKRFLQGLAWWELEPRFGSWQWMIPWQFTPWLGARYSVASGGNDMYVAYFYNPSRVTGLLRGLGSGPYAAEWFNPRSGETVPVGAAAPLLGMYCIPCKPDRGDWVFYLYRAGEK